MIDMLLDHQLMEVVERLAFVSVFKLVNQAGSVMVLDLLKLLLQLEDAFYELMRGSIQLMVFFDVL